MGVGVATQPFSLIHSLHLPGSRVRSLTSRSAWASNCCRSSRAVVTASRSASVLALTHSAQA